MNAERRIEDLLRELAPQVLGTLVRRHGQFDACEDAVQEALLAAALQWPAEGVPDRPRSWLLTVAGRSLVDAWRSESARRHREQAAMSLEPAGRELDTDPHGAGYHPAGQDDTLVLLFLCCHPALSPPSQLALTLRAVGGLTTTEIAAAFLAPEATIAKRITRAKQRIRNAGARFELPPESERTERLCVVLHVLYLLFNEGYTATAGPELHRADLTAEAIRLTRVLHRLLPGEGEVAGLLALMLLTDARRAARTDTDGSIVPLDEQRRELWDAVALADVAPGPVVTLSRAVALARVHGPKAGLALLGTLDNDGRMAHTHRLEAVRAHLLEQAGDTAAARESYLRAAKMTASVPEQRYLTLRAARLQQLARPADPAG